MGVCCRLFNYLVRPRKGDTAEDERIKRVAFPVSFFICLLTMYVSLNNLASSFMISCLGNGSCAFGHLIFMIGVVLNVAPARYMVDVMFVWQGMGLLMTDLGSAVLSYPFRVWSFVVLVLDGALVLNRDHVPHIVIPFTILYVAAESLESSVRYGLYDLGSWGINAEDNFCNCAKPPCT
eukprot:Hpha_TRINITY_DN16679_c2_g8::TRINITY_DN16679_c2_g8_i1::g.181077::m.181077